MSYILIMAWCWEHKNWAEFSYDASIVDEYESKLSYRLGKLYGAVSHLENDEKNHLIVNILTDEADNTSKIEGEYLNRDSLQSSLRKHFNLHTDKRKVSSSEHGIAEMMTDLYRNYSDTLKDDTMHEWHNMIMAGSRYISDIGKYRTHDDDMQIISGSIGDPKVHYIAPPSKKMTMEMANFVEWYNKFEESPLVHAAIAHLYFVIIHPYEDGNGRIARALAEKSLSTSLNKPILSSISHAIRLDKNRYYDELAKTNHSLEITNWVKYFSELILIGIDYSNRLVKFSIDKGRLLARESELNERQLKIINLMLSVGLHEFGGGMTAKKYAKITNTSRPTANRDIADLVEKNVLISKGDSVSTAYELKILFN